MEPSKEAISVRVSRLNTQLLGKNILSQNGTKSLVTRESLLDALTVLYDECNTDNLKRSDKYIAQFVDKFRATFSEIKKLRVNISDFEVKNVIGRGHFGEVHVVREKQTGDVYAMKTIRKSDSLNHQSASYEEERDIMAITQSPWLTSLQYAFQDSAHLYLVMEFHPGGDLYGLLDRQGGTLSEEHATFYLSELVQAINTLHTMGYVHRDVKPDNVLLDRCGHLKLADFGSSAKLGAKGTVSDKDVMSVGTPDYVAPEVLQSNDKGKNRKVSYGSGCDYWSLGVLAYEITVGNTPFGGPTVSSTYNKIMNHSTHLKFPPDANLSSAYVTFIRNLLTDQNSRLGYKQILDHPLFKDTNWTDLRDQVPPFVPKVNGVDDTSNFLDVNSKKSTPSIDNFKSRTQFSGRNLPFVGFTYTNDTGKEFHQNGSVKERKSDEALLENKKKQVENLQKRLAKVEHSSKEYEALERKYEECSRKFESVEVVRGGLEKELASSIAESSALRRTLDLERRERKELETRALELIKSAKLKWELAEKERVAKLNEEIDKQNTRITELCTSNNEFSSKLQRYETLLEQAEQELDRLRNLQSEHKDSLVKARALSRQSIAGVENRLERMTSETQSQLSDLQTKLSAALESKTQLESQLDSSRKREQDLQEQYVLSKELCDTVKTHLDTTSNRCKDLENEVSQLQSVMKNAESLKLELQKCKEEIDRLKEDSNKCNRLEASLKREEQECSALKKQLKKLSENLDESLVVHEASLQELETRREEDIRTFQSQITQASEERESLNLKLQKAHEREITNKIKVQGLEQLLSRLESGVTKLETNSDRDTVVQEQLKKLEDQIRELHEASALEKQELRAANTALWRKEKELSNSELDKRIVERELKTSEEKIKKMDEEIANLSSTIQEQKMVHDDLIKEITQRNEDLTQEVAKLQGVIKEVDVKALSFKEKYEAEKITVEKTNNKLNNVVRNIEKLNKELENEVKSKKYLERELQNVSENNIKLHYSMDMSKKNEFEAQNELENYKRELENAQLNISVLRDACTLLENQLEEYEHLITAHEAKTAKLTDSISKLDENLLRAKEEISEAKKALNEERSQKLLFETRAKRLQEDVELLKRECSSYKDQVVEYKNLSAQLTEDLTAAEERCSEVEATLRATERQVEGLKIENLQLKEESSQRLTSIHQMRESNYKLNQEVLDCKEENATLSLKINELEESLNVQLNYYKQREMKAEATIQQQTKLIDFLQSKIEDGKKKKTLSDKLFGSSKKENLHPALALNYRDLESMLSKERESNKHLKEQIQKLKAETLPNPRTEVNFTQRSNTPPNSPRTKLALEQLVRSPASQNGEFQRKPSIQRMHHNIPHRFESRLCKKSSKCAGCSDSIQLGRTVSTCSECSVTAHPRCVHQVPRTCGLPNEYAKHFKRTLSETSTSSSAQKGAGAPISTAAVEGWLKIPSRGAWEKKYGRLEDSTLALYEHEPCEGLAPSMSTVELCPSDGWTCVCGDVQPEDAGNTAATDLPFIIRVEVHPKTTCWPPTAHLIMLLSAPDKDRWLTALNQLFQRKYPEFTRNTFTPILKLSKNLDPVCIQELSKELLLLGCEGGLFGSRQGNSPVQISGPSCIQQIGIAKPLNTALMIGGPNRQLLRSDLRHLESVASCAPCTEPTLRYSVIELNRDGFHMFQMTDLNRSSKAAFFVCAATSKQLIIIKFEEELGEFVPLRVLDTAEPCACILFSEHSVIVGANKFFEIDLKTFHADEFLDASDRRLKHAVDSYKVGSYPVHIMRVNNQPLEYLICFSEFGVFVDEFGRKNREIELKWSHLPLAFAYCAPFLYMVQFSAVEIIRIAPETFDDTSLQSWICPDSVRLEFTKPKFLGANKRGIYLCVKNEVVFVDGRAVCDDDFSVASSADSEIVSEQDGSDAGTEFSFTSSLVNSLDRASSIEESEKRVQFSDRPNL